MVNGEPPPFFDETPSEHQRRVHPDAIVAASERTEFEQRFKEKFTLATGQSRLRRVFEHRHVVLAVVHVESLEQALANASGLY